MVVTPVKTGKRGRPRFPRFRGRLIPSSLYEGSFQFVPESQDLFPDAPYICFKRSLKRPFPLSALSKICLSSDGVSCTISFTGRKVEMPARQIDGFFSTCVFWEVSTLVF